MAQDAATSTEPSLAEKLRWLRLPDTYPGGADPITTIETHFAWVFFTRDRAYKLKKPVRLERMDFGSLAARHWNCLEELRLNRRLAPTVYLAAVPLVRRRDGRLALEAPGEVVEWLVKMVRLDARQMLDARLRRGDLEAKELRPALQLLARFYRDQPRIAQAPNLFRRRIEAQVERNRSDLLDPALGLPSAQVRELASRQLEFLASHHELFARRAERSALVEGHGDLRPEHIFLGAPPCVIDCLEFDRDLRLNDPVEEIAFLGLECTMAGAGWVLGFALDTYASVCDDRPAGALVDFYTAHRAVTRAKVVAWHLRDPVYRHTAPWAEIATRYLNAGGTALDRARGRRTSAIQGEARDG